MRFLVVTFKIEYLVIIVIMNILKLIDYYKSINIYILKIK